MPTFSNYANFVYVNLGFVVLIAIMMYFRSAVDIKDNWPLYRCNPPYWVFSEDISRDFTYCVQNSQINIMGNLLQPITYLISSLSESGGELSENMNGIRKMLSTIRSFTSGAIENVFGVFLNIIIEFQRMVINMKDMMGKTIGMVVAMVYILDGSIKTMESAWAGPNGQLVRALGSCFHPDTLIKLYDGSICKMADVKVGAKLEDGCKVRANMRIANLSKGNYYIIKDGVNGTDVFVTGEHYVMDPTQQKFMQVKYYNGAKITDIMDDEVCCLITTNNKIKLGNILFWDWEDDKVWVTYYR